MMERNDSVSVPGFACSDFSPKTASEVAAAKFEVEDLAQQRILSDCVIPSSFESNTYQARIAELEAELAPFKRPGSQWVDMSKVVYPNAVLDLHLTLVNPGIIYPNGRETVRGWLLTYCGVGKCK